MTIVQAFVLGACLGSVVGAFVAGLWFYEKGLIDGERHARGDHYHG